MHGGMVHPLTSLFTKHRTYRPCITNQNKQHKAWDDEVSPSVNQAIKCPSQGWKKSTHNYTGLRYFHFQFVSFQKILITGTIIQNRADSDNSDFSSQISDSQIIPSFRIIPSFPIILISPICFVFLGELLELLDKQKFIGKIGIIGNVMGNIRNNEFA